jgi:two-component system KDP operon response regulator KdpE
LCAGWRSCLRGAGCVVAAARSRVDVLARVIADPPDVLVLDLVLAGGPGVELCGAVRRVSAVPILVLSAVGEEAELLRALDAGGDDFLTRPFGMDELLGRLGPLLRGARGAAASAPLELGELTIDVDSGRVMRAGEAVHLGPVEFALVRELAERHGRLVTDRQLLRALWGSECGHLTRELRVLVAGVRRKLEREPSSPEHLITEAGVGYRLCEHGRRVRPVVLR